MIKFNTITTKRFKIRKLTLSDVTSSYLGWFQDDVTKREISQSYESHELEKLRLYVLEKTRQEDCLFLGIFDCLNDHHIGNIKYEPINFSNGDCFMGILIGDKNYRGIGLAREIMEPIETHLKNLGVNKIFLGVSNTNLPAIRAYEKNGFYKTAQKVNALDSSFIMAKDI